MKWIPNRESLGGGLTASAEWHDGDDGFDVVYSIDGHEICSVGHVGEDLRVDVYETTALGPHELLNLVRGLLLAGGRMMQMEHASHLRSNDSAVSVPLRRPIPGFPGSVPMEVF